MDVGAALAAVQVVRHHPRGVAGRRAARARRASTPARQSVDLLVAATADPDPITAVAAVRALGAQGGAVAARQLVALLDDDREHVAEHAVEALGWVDPQPSGVATLVARCAEGGFTAMLAQRTLETWANGAPDAVRAGLAAALTSQREPGARARLVETLGLVRGPAVTGAAHPDRRGRRRGGGRASRGPGGAGGPPRRPGAP